MPELPEVETIRSQLSIHFPAEIISLKQSRNISGIAHTPLRKLKGKKILKIKRKGKMLFFELSEKYYLLSHLGMTGTWRYSTSPLKEKHGHLELKIKKNDQSIYYLTYVDPRRFGHMYFYDKEKAFAKLDELGIDLKDKKFTLDYFTSSLIRYPNRFIKVTLLDQKLFAGTGNYIASEICAHAGVLPQRRVSSLSRNEIKKLYLSVDKVLGPALETGGTTFQGGYQDSNGDKGKGVSGLIVFYQKICQKCLNNKVTKIILGSRGTYYCSNCQR